MWFNMSLCTVITWCNVTVCLFDIHWVQYRNGINTSTTYFTIFHSSWVVSSGRYSVYFRFWSHYRVNTRNRQAGLRNSSVEFQTVFTCIIGSTARGTLAFWKSIKSFRRPGDRVINTVSILYKMKVSFRTFNVSWNTDFLNYLCQTWCHCWHLINFSIALFSNSLTLHNVYASFSANCWSPSWASQELVRPFTPRLVMNTPKASCMACAMHGMWFLIAGHWIPENSSVDCNLGVIE